MEKIKCYEISPSTNTSFDTMIIEAGKGWAEAIETAEQSLEDQFCQGKDWGEISVTIKCVYKTRKELEELETA